MWIRVLDKSDIDSFIILLNAKRKPKEAIKLMLCIEIESPFGLYFGALCGVYGKSNIQTINELKSKFESIVGHHVVVYKYGKLFIDGDIAIVAGGGLSETIEEIGKKGIKVLITGITVKNEFTKNAHDYAKENKITILGGTHYSTEKFACMKICEYFKKNNITAEFIEDIPVYADM